MQPTEPSQVFRQEGTTLGHGRVSTGPGGLDELPTGTSVVPDGTVPDGAVSDGTVPDGTLPVSEGWPGCSGTLVLGTPVPEETLVMVSVTGQMVVLMAITDVTVAVLLKPPGQLVTDGPQLVMTSTLVEKMVLVVM